MSPSELLDDHIPVDHHLSNVNWMIAPNLVVWYSLIFTGIAVREKFTF
jgi:hypothetical protein